jgi:predicted MFS family arabinose efflux permease
VGFNTARAVGPALAGIVLDVWGSTTTFALNAVSFAVVLAGLAVVRIRPAATPPSRRTVRAEFADGVRYSWRHRSMELCMYSALAMTLFGASVAQLAAGVATDIFDVGGGGLGLLVGAYGVGSAITALTLTVVADRLPRSSVALGGIFLYGVGVLGVVATRTVPVGMAGYFAMGIAHILVGISTNTTIQAQVEEAYRGRVMSLYLMCMVAGMPIGALVGGRLGDAIGLRETLGAFGVVLLLYGLWATLRWHRFADLDRDVAVAKGA